MIPEKYSEGLFKSTISEFQITYMYREGVNMYVPKISRCVLKNMSVDYSPEGVFTTFKGDDKGAHASINKNGFNIYRDRNNDKRNNRTIESLICILDNFEKFITI